MKRFIFVTMLVVLCASLLGPEIGEKCVADQSVTLEILFMNHGPMQPTIRGLKSLIQRHAGKIRPLWFDFDQKTGKEFMNKKGIREHIPLLIYINGTHTFDVKGKRVTFMGFPSGEGPYQFQGKWTFQDLEELIVSMNR
ncbi:MAG: hypothetical protein HY913_09575 [Desulfomonile tiedjei]|nr:hypothetical protein [Desulfomonile tiedjei]